MSHNSFINMMRFIIDHFIFFQGELRFLHWYSFLFQWGRCHAIICWLERVLSLNCVFTNKVILLSLTLSHVHSIIWIRLKWLLHCWVLIRNLWALFLLYNWFNSFNFLRHLISVKSHLVIKLLIDILWADAFIKW